MFEAMFSDYIDFFLIRILDNVKFVSELFIILELNTFDDLFDV